MATALSVYYLKKRFEELLRNNDVLTTTQRGVSTVTQYFSGDASTTIFALTYSNAKNVRSVSTGGSTKTEYVDYYVDFESAFSGGTSPTVVFVSAPTSGTSNVVVSYDYGTDRIFTEYPRGIATLTSFPRIAIMADSVATNEFGLGGSAQISDVLLNVTVFSPKEHDVEDIIKSVRQVIFDNKKNVLFGWYSSGWKTFTIQYISPISQSPMLYTPERDNKILQRSHDFACKFIQER